MVPIEKSDCNVVGKRNSRRVVGVLCDVSVAPLASRKSSKKREMSMDGSLFSADGKHEIYQYNRLHRQYQDSHIDNWHHGTTQTSPRLRFQRLGQKIG